MALWRRCESFAFCWLVCYHISLVLSVFLSFTQSFSTFENEKASGADQMVLQRLALVERFGTISIKASILWVLRARGWVVFKDFIWLSRLIKSYQLGCCSIYGTLGVCQCMTNFLFSWTSEGSLELLHVKLRQLNIFFSNMFLYKIWLKKAKLNY